MFLFDSIVMTSIILGIVLRITEGFPFYNYLYISISFLSIL